MNPCTSSFLSLYFDLTAFLLFTFSSVGLTFEILDDSGDGFVCKLRLHLFRSAKLLAGTMEVDVQCLGVTNGEKDRAF